MQKQVKKLKVQTLKQEISVDLVAKVCFAQPIVPRRPLHSAEASEAEETKSQTTAASEHDLKAPTAKELASLTTIRLGF